jgi:hypothetical protein
MLGTVTWLGLGQAAHARRTQQVPAARWHVTETRNFRIYSYGTRLLDPRIASRCEALRSQVALAWLGEDEDRRWTPKCVLVMHATHASYRSAVGMLADCTVASCIIDAIGERTQSRRVDVCAYCSDWLDYLPHELTHVALDGRLTTGDLARWADEGMALVADPEKKRVAHERDVRIAVANGRQFRMVELLALAEYPLDDRLGIFYGQSLSVVEFLVDRGGRQRFVTFVQLAMRDGYDAALRGTYGIRDVPELDALWLTHLHRTHPNSRFATLNPSDLRDHQGEATGATVERTTADVRSDKPRSST